MHRHWPLEAGLERGQRQVSRNPVPGGKEGRAVARTDWTRRAAELRLTSIGELTCWAMPDVCRRLRERPEGLAISPAMARVA